MIWRGGGDGVTIDSENPTGDMLLWENLILKIEANGDCRIMELFLLILNNTMKNISTKIEHLKFVLNITPGLGQRMSTNEQNGYYLLDVA